MSLHDDFKSSKSLSRVLFSLCILAVISNVALLLQEAFDQESTFINTLNKDVELGREEDPGYFPDYPQITLCRKPFYRADFNDSYRNLVEYSFLALGYPFIPFTPEEVSMIVEISMKLDHEKLKSEVLKFHNHLEDMEKRFQQLQNSTVDFNLQHFVMNNSVKCEEFFLYCIALVFPLNCCDIFRPVLTSMGLCYALIDSKEILRLLENAPVDFSVIIDLFSPPHLERSTEEGFNVFLSDPSETSLFFQPSEGQKIVPGLVTTVNAQLVKTERSALHTPWHSLTVNCPKWPFSSDPLNLKPHRYSYRTCDTYTYFISLRKACNCESVFFPGIPTLRYCRPKDIYICFTAATIANNFTDLVNICRQPCIVYRYKSEASYIGLGGENLSRLEIMYNSKQFVNHEYRTVTLSSLFSQIGGSLGLYLGASIITVVEIVTFVASWLWYRIYPLRNIKVHQNSTPSQRNMKDYNLYSDNKDYF